MLLRLRAPSTLGVVRSPSAWARSFASEASTDSASSSPPPSPPSRHSSSPSSQASNVHRQHQLGSLIPLLRTSTDSTTDLSPMNNASGVQFPHNVRNALTIRTLMAANLHLGHNRRVWNQNMLPYIYGERQGIHIINLEHTLVMLRRAINVTREVALRGGNILFVGTRTSLHRIVVEAAKRADAYYVNSWVGGTITNKERVLRRSVGYDPDKVAQTLVPHDSDNATPSPRAKGRRINKQDVSASEPSSSNNNDRRPRNPQPYVHTPDLLIVLDYANNAWAVREANQANIPVIALCDTDCNPRRVQYPIPANDDSLTGVELVAGALSLASREGRDLRRKHQEENATREAEQAIRSRDRF
ncbi:37S ribosomal protein, mitochondrial [Thoreauomyces humboldtii]|nr:37S ribosomal protein, mitochondrial [Thoreauomyces humboldtii]